MSVHARSLRREQWRWILVGILCGGAATVGLGLLFPPLSLLVPVVGVPLATREGKHFAIGVGTGFIVVVAGGTILALLFVRTLESWRPFG